MFFHETVRFPAGERSSQWAKTTWRASKSRGSTSIRTPAVRGHAPRSFVNMAFRGNSQGLDGGHAKRQHETAVIAMHHNQNPDRSRGQAPAVLSHLFPLCRSVHSRGGSTVRVGFAGNAEHAREILAETVEVAVIRGDKRLHCSGEESPANFSFSDLRLLITGIDSSASCTRDGIPRFYLPEKLPRANKRRGVLELPPHDVRPLVQTEREVEVTMDPAGICQMNGETGKLPGYMMVSEVGRMATGSCCSEESLRVIQATSTCSFSFLRASPETNMGKEAF